MRKLQRDLLLISAILLSTTLMFGQNQIKKKADIQYSLKAYDLAVNSYQKYLSSNENDIDAMAMLAESFYRSNDLISAARWYEKATSIPNHSMQYDIRFGKILMKMGLYDRAESQFNKISGQYSELARHYKKSCNFAKNMLAMEDKYIVSQMRLSSPYDEFGTEIIDGKLIFCSYKNNSKTNNSLIQREANSLFVYDLSSGKNENFVSGIKDFSGIGPIHYSPSGKYVVYTRNGFINGILQVTGDEKDMSVYIAEVDENGRFINEEALPFNDLKYSSAFACFGKNDNTIYYSSNKNSDNFDIYVSEKIDGNWTKGIALNSNINTAGNEITPYFADGKLYFSSDYLNGIGGYDVFKTTKYKNEWSYPVNLGKGVNSPGDDIYFFKGDDNDQMYITSNRLRTKGGYDIYSARPSKNISEDELVYSYMPKAVELNNLKENNAKDINISSSKTVSFSIEAAQDISLDNAKMIAYDEIILSPSSVYFIQLASLSRSKVDGRKFRKLTRFGNVYKVKKGQLTKIRLGYFVSRDEAQAVLASVKKQGYRDAFIVEDILNSSELELLESNYTFNNNKKYKKPANTSEYKIKLAAYSNPLYFNVNKVKDLGVIEQWSKGKWTIFILSGYMDFNDARKAMLKARNRGFTTAEMVIDDNGILTRVKNN
jgi:tetratricopeptide (TPR) repeat protein